METLVFNFFRRIRRKVLYWIWLFQIRCGSEISLDTDDSVIVIVSSYKRMFNIDPILESLLKCLFVKKIIVTNNNPEVNIHDWIKTTDPRVDLMNQPHRMPAGFRWFLAKDEPGEYFIAIDDDFLIYPEQLKGLVAQLIHQPEVPHGLFGSNFVRCLHSDVKQLQLSYFKRREMEIDVLHGIYGVTRRHVRNFFKYLKRLEENQSISSGILYSADNKVMLSVGDDILISYSGESRPKIHDFGRLVFCQTANDPAISIHSKAGFMECRLKILESLEKIQLNEKREKQA